MNDEKLVVELVYSLVWMVATKWESFRYRPEIDNLNFAPDLEVRSPLSFSIESDEDNPDELEQLLRNLHSAEICTVGETDFEHRAYVQLEFDEPNFRATLRKAKIDNFLRHHALLKTFLEGASWFDQHFESSKDGRRALAAFPIGRDWFSAPRHFIEPIKALSNAGYCESENGQFRWSQSIEPHMKAAKLWVGDKTIHQVRDAELKRIWDTMPERLKAPFVDHALDVKGFDVLSFAMVMGQFWYDGRWHDAPEDPESLRRGELRGGYVPTAKELGKLYDEGQLRD